MPFTPSGTGPTPLDTPVRSPPLNRFTLPLHPSFLHFLHPLTSSAPSPSPSPHLFYSPTFSAPSPPLHPHPSSTPYPSPTPRQKKSPLENRPFTPRKDSPRQRYTHPLKRIDKPDTSFHESISDSPFKKSTSEIPRNHIQRTPKQRLHPTYPLRNRNHIRHRNKNHP